MTSTSNQGRFSDVGYSVEQENSLLSRSKSLCIPILISQNCVKNIGSLDKLGNFKLDPNLRSSLKIENTSYWDRLKREFLDRSESEVECEAEKIINEVLFEVLQNTPADRSEPIKNLLTESI